MNLICRLKGHIWIFQKNVSNGSLYKGDCKDENIVLWAKEYKCSRCDEVRSGLSVTKEDHDVLMNHAQMAQAQHEHDMSMLPQRVKLLEDKLRREETEKNGTERCQHEKTGLLFSAFKVDDKGVHWGQCAYCDEWFDLSTVKMPEGIVKEEENKI
jgi:hypothetical protein